MSITVTPYVGNSREWGEFGRAQPGWTAFHRWEWKALIEGLYGHQCPFQAARDPQGALVGILPLVRVRSRVFGHFLVSMPFVSYGGPLGSDAAVQALSQHADALARREGAKLLELRSARELPVQLPVSHRKVTVVLPIEGGSAVVFGKLKAKLRSQVRRPEKEGVTMRFGEDQVDAFHAVFARHMRDLGTPAQSKVFFRAIADQFGDDVWFGCAYLNDVPIACGAGFRWGTEFEITWASALREWSHVSANMGLYWAFIERAADAGLTRFNFGRCTAGSATHRFKLQWGGVEEALWWYQGGGALGASTPSADSAKFALATKVWRRLPVPIATMLGHRIVRYIP